MSPATSEAERVRFHTLNRKTGNAVVSSYIDSVTGRVVKEEDQVKGYQRGEGDYVILEDDEIDAVALESARTIDIDMFTQRDRIEWIWYDKPHYLTPNDTVGAEAFAVIRDAMASTGMVGIARLVLYRRERAVMLAPKDAGIILWTLHYGDELRPDGDYFASLIEGKLDAQPMSLVRKLIDSQSTPWNSSFVKDPVQDRLLEIIASKRKSRKRAAKAKYVSEAAPAGNVVNIMDALRQSMKSEPIARIRKK